MRDEYEPSIRSMPDEVWLNSLTAVTCQVNDFENVKKGNWDYLNEKKIDIIELSVIDLFLLDDAQHILVMKLYSPFEKYSFISIF